MLGVLRHVLRIHDAVKSGHVELRYSLRGATLGGRTVGIERVRKGPAPVRRTERMRPMPGRERYLYVNPFDIQFRLLSRIGGVEILGVDLRERLPAAVQARLRVAWRDHGLLLFRGQDLDDAAQLLAAETFGSIARKKKHDDEAHSYVSNVVADGLNPYGGLGFHFDDSFESEPLAGLVLYGIEVPPPGAGGETLFSNVGLAYAALPSELRDRIRDLQVVHSWPDLSKAVPMPGPDPRSGMPSAVHPIVLRHPVTGEKLLFLSPRHFDRILGMDDQRAAALVTELSAFITDPKFVYKHAWRRGDFVVWDNLRFQHARADFDPKHRRHLRRTPIARMAVDVAGSIRLVPVSC